MYILRSIIETNMFSFRLLTYKEWISLKFTDPQHCDCVTIGKRPKTVDSRRLPDLHVDTRRAGCCGNESAFPGGRKTYVEKILEDTGF